MIRDSIPHKMVAIPIAAPRLKVKKLDSNAITPNKANYGDLGYDLYALEDTVLQPSEVTKVRTGIALGFPDGYGAIIRDRSSVATKTKLQVVAGVIDQGYTGEIIVAFYNGDGSTNWPSTIRAGDKIAQLVLQKVETFQIEEVDELGNTERGANGFGSSGTR